MLTSGAVGLTVYPQTEQHYSYDNRAT